MMNSQKSTNPYYNGRQVTKGGRGSQPARPFHLINDTFYRKSKEDNRYVLLNELEAQAYNGTLYMRDQSRPPQYFPVENDREKNDKSDHENINRRKKLTKQERQLAAG